MSHLKPIAGPLPLLVPRLAITYTVKGDHALVEIPVTPAAPRPQALMGNFLVKVSVGEREEGWDVVYNEPSLVGTPLTLDAYHHIRLLNDARAVLVPVLARDPHDVALHRAIRYLDDLARTLDWDAGLQRNALRHLVPRS